MQLRKIPELFQRAREWKAWFHPAASVHLNEDTRGFLNSNLISRMKPGAYLINTARGALVEERALLDALDSGCLSGAGLDTFSEQPLPAESPLRKHPAVLATPYMSAHTDGAANRMGCMALENCLAVLRGVEPPNRVIS